MTRTIRAESMRASGKLRCKCGTERKSIDYIIGGTNVNLRVSDLMLPWDDNASTNCKYFSMLASDDKESANDFYCHQEMINCLQMLFDSSLR